MNRFEELKTAGNAALQNGKLDRALERYTAALSRAESVEQAAVGLSNRSLVHLRQGNPSDALADADKAITANSAYKKAHFRRAKALQALGRDEEAVKAYVKSDSELPANLTKFITCKPAKSPKGAVRQNCPEPQRETAPARPPTNRIDYSKWNNIGDIDSEKEAAEEEKEKATNAAFGAKLAEKLAKPPEKCAPVPQVDHTARTASARKELMGIYSAHAPEVDVNAINSLLKTYAGNEDELIEHVKTKYVATDAPTSVFAGADGS
jgi:tetratricopeptide (TPR) repeat protein